MVDIGGLVSLLRGAQNTDGGWGYRGGSSWTEPTVYALLALLATGKEPGSVPRGLEWLRRTRRPDGGWPPHPSVDQSTWVTALVALLPRVPGAPEVDAAGRNWLLGQKGRESTLLIRLRWWLLGVEAGQEAKDPGWPWFPGTAGWVAPTALTVLALEKLDPQRGDREIQERLEMGRRFLLARQCRDGGWNHGGSRTLGYETDSYPETSGLVLLALHRISHAKLSRALAHAEEHLRLCRSAEVCAWLQLGLLAHGWPLPERRPDLLPCRSIPDTALSVLAEAAKEGRNLFLG
jgi:hypothetical protein